MTQSPDSSQPESVSDPLRILVVDDEPDICEFLSEDLEHLGYSVKCANGVDEAFQIFGFWHPRVVVSDVRMPNKSGLDLLDLINQSQNPVPVIFISGYSDVSLKQIYMRGAAGLLSKPLDFDELFKQITKATQLNALAFGTRTSNRVPTNFPIRFSSNVPSVSTPVGDFQNRRQFSGVVENLSRRGVFVTVAPEHIPEVGVMLSFSFVDPKGLLPAIIGTGFCRWIHQPSQEGGSSSILNTVTYGFGIEFEDIAPESLEALFHYAANAGTYWAPGRHNIKA
jgi:CheY-like chemotaxis protein